jgi:hypothetical protein
MIKNNEKKPQETPRWLSGPNKHQAKNKKSEDSLGLRHLIFYLGF